MTDWLRIQKEKSVLPQPGSLLVETFPRGERSYMVIYPFEGRLAHQTLGMLLTRRLERAGAALGFIATDYHRRMGPARHGAMFKRRQARYRNSSTRTCWATISKPGCRRASC